MRFKLILEVNKKAYGNIIPINYQYEQSAAIYKILSYGDKEYAAWLHENGFQLENGKTFKLFTFSRFKIEKGKILNDRLQILSDTVEWQISFLPEKSTEKFITGVFNNQIFEIGDKRSCVQLIVKSIEVIPLPDFSESMQFSTMSPMCLKFKREDGNIDYISPKDVRAKKILLVGLADKYYSLYGIKPDFSVDDMAFDVLNDPKPVLVTMKSNTASQTKVRGYMFKFKINAPVELLKVMYDGGAGSLCSQGFGCLKIDKNK